MTPEWEHAVRTGEVASLDLLSATAEAVDQRDRYGQTGLMLATLQGQSDVADWLIRQGADLDHTAKFGLSALMLAAINGRTIIARHLIAAGANQDLQATGAAGFVGMTALDLARQGKHDHIVAPLQAQPRRSAPVEPLRNDAGDIDDGRPCGVSRPLAGMISSDMFTGPPIEPNE